MPGGSGIGVVPVDDLTRDVLGVPAFVWIALAGVGFLAALVLAIVALRRRGRGWLREVPRPGTGFEREGQPRVRVRDLLETVTPDDAVAGVLRWLLYEAEAEAVAYLELAPGGRELLWIEPRGLDASTVGRLARLAREALVLPDTDVREAGNGAIVRWLGMGGSKTIVLSGPPLEVALEPLRFTRYLIESSRASKARGVSPPGEARVRSIPGIAWAETGADGSTLRLLLEEGADRASTLADLDRALEGSEVSIEWIEVPDRVAGPEVIGAPSAPPPEPTPRPAEPVPAPTEPVPGPAPEPTGEPGAEVAPAAEALTPEIVVETPSEPRIQLLDVVVSTDGQVTADVRVTWRDRELRGRGHGRSSDAGRYYAGAQAIADALRPLLDTDVVVEGLYTARTRDGLDVLIAEVLFEGDRFVGAVVEEPGRSEWSGARSVLDAVNRRLTQVAGRSGPI